MKKIFFIALILLVLAGLGAGYYYLEFYQSKQYAEAAARLFENDLQPVFETVSKTEIKNSGDYQAVIDAMTQERGEFFQIQNKLLALKPPASMKKIHQDFSELIEKSLTKTSEVKRKAQFFSNAIKFLKIFRPEIPPPYSSDPPVFSFPPGRTTVGQTLIIWQERLPKVKTIAAELFEQEPLELKEVSFSQLKSLWQESERGLDLMLGLLQNSDPSLFLDKAKLDFKSEEDKKEAVNIDKAFKEFPPILISAIYENSARDIFSEAVSNEELNKLTDFLGKEIQELKTRYSK